MRFTNARALAHDSHAIAYILFCTLTTEWDCGFYVKSKTHCATLIQHTDWEQLCCSRMSDESIFVGIHVKITLSGKIPVICCNKKRFRYCENILSSYLWPFFVWMLPFVKQLTAYFTHQWSSQSGSWVQIIQNSNMWKSVLCALCSEQKPTRQWLPYTLQNYKSPLYRR